MGRALFSLFFEQGKFINKIIKAALDLHFPVKKSRSAWTF
jgi:hypothetical protein